MDVDAALRDFNQAIDSALAIPQRDAKTNSKLAAAYWGRGHGYLIKDGRASAQEDFRQVIELAKPDSPGSYLIRGMAHQYTGDLAKAIADFDQSIRLDSRDRCGCAYVLRAQAYFEHGDARRAFTDLARASRYAPHSPMVYFAHGILLSNSGDHSAAIPHLSKAIELNPNLGIAYAVRGLAHKQSGDDADALADLTRAISRMPNYAHGYLARGQLYRESKDYDRAIVDFTQAVALDPSLGLGYVERAHSYLEKKQYDLAMADATRAIQLRPLRHLSTAHLMRGRAHLGKGAVDAAIADLSQAIELQPSLGAYSYRALAYERGGDKQRALSDLNNARGYTQDGSSQRRWVEDELKIVEAMAD